MKLTKQQNTQALSHLAYTTFQSLPLPVFLHLSLSFSQYFLFNTPYTLTLTSPNDSLQTLLRFSFLKTSA